MLFGSKADLSLLPSPSVTHRHIDTHARLSAPSWCLCPCQKQTTLVFHNDTDAMTARAKYRDSACQMP